MTLADFAGWVIEITHLLLTAAVVIVLAWLAWSLSQPVAERCVGNQDYSETNFTGQAPMDLDCDIAGHPIHIPWGGR